MTLIYYIRVIKKDIKVETMMTHSDPVIYTEPYSPFLKPNRESNICGDYDQDSMSIEEGLGHGPDANGPKSSPITTQFNIMNTVMGVAIISLPNVFLQIGIVFGSVCMILFLFLHYWTCIYLIKAKNLNRHANYTTIGKNSVGNWVVPIVKFVMIFNAIGVCQLY